MKKSAQNTLSPEKQNYLENLIKTCLIIPNEQNNEKKEKQLLSIINDTISTYFLPLIENCPTIKSLMPEIIVKELTDENGEPNLSTAAIFNPNDRTILFNSNHVFYNENHPFPEKDDIAKTLNTFNIISSVPHELQHFLNFLLMAEHVGEFEIPEEELNFIKSLSHLTAEELLDENSKIYMGINGEEKMRVVLDNQHKLFPFVEHINSNLSRQELINQAALLYLADKDEVCAREKEEAFLHQLTDDINTLISLSGRKEEIVFSSNNKLNKKELLEDFIQLFIEEKESRLNKKKLTPEQLKLVESLQLFITPSNLIDELLVMGRAAIANQYKTSNASAVEYITLEDGTTQEMPQALPASLPLSDVISHNAYTIFSALSDKVQEVYKIDKEELFWELVKYGLTPITNVEIIKNPLNSFFTSSKYFEVLNNENICDESLRYISTLNEDQTNSLIDTYTEQGAIDFINIMLTYMDDDLRDPSMINNFTASVWNSLDDGQGSITTWNKKQSEKIKNCINHFIKSLTTKIGKITESLDETSFTDIHAFLLSLGTTELCIRTSLGANSAEYKQFQKLYNQLLQIAKLKAEEDLGHKISPVTQLKDLNPYLPKHSERVEHYKKIYGDNQFDRASLYRRISVEATNTADENKTSYNEENDFFNI